MSRRPRFAAHLGVRTPGRPLFNTLAASANPIDQMRFAAQQGLAGITDNFLTLRSAELQARMGEQARLLGLAFGSFVHDPLHWNQPIWSVRDAIGRSSLRESFARSLDAAALSGSATINCVTGYDPDTGRQSQMDAMAGNLAWAGDDAAGLGVTLCIEATHPAFAPGALIEQLSEALALLERLNHPQIRLNFDIGHVALHGEDVPAAIAASCDWIGLVQAADVPGRVEPGAGVLDWPAILLALQDAGYTGLIELELETSEAGPAGEQALLDRLAALSIGQ